jgi:outer membrane protein assembly factor BamD (BamD/ComL family)
MLKAKKKYSKQELKQDEFILALMKTKSFLEDNARQISYVAVGILAMIVLIVFYINSKKDAERDAASLLSTAQEQLRFGQRDNAVATFNEVLNQYDGTPAAGNAAFFLGKSYWEDSDFVQAKHYFGIYVEDYADKNIMTQAACAGYADCLVNEKDYLEAAKYYEKAATTDSNFPLTVAYFYSAAQAYRDGGDYAKAKILAKKVIDDYNDPTFKSRAEVLLESLSL